MSGFDFEIPVVIVGGGACGCTAALAARDAGASVLVIEQDAKPLGSTGMSQGLICAAGTKSQAALAIEDDGDIFFADIMTKTRGEADPVIARALAYESGPTLDWLVERHGLPWEVDEGFRPSFGNSTYRVHHWPEHSGTDLIGLLHRKLDDMGVDVLLEARFTDIVADADGRVQGIEIERRDGARERIGCRALVLAAGGFAANHDMLRRFIPEMAEARNNGHEGSTGEAIMLGARLGGQLADMGAYQGYAMLTEPQGISVPPNILFEGGIIVNAQGRRFTDETADIAGMVQPVLAQPGGHCWVIFDARIEGLCGYIPEMQTLIALDAAKSGKDPAALATLIGVDVEALTAELDHACAAKQAGAVDRHGRLWGHDRPPAPDYRALKVTGAIYHTQGGLQIDGRARVLRPDGTPLPNLLAGGGSARSVSGPSSWGYLPAMGLCTAITLGRLAGEEAARLALATEPVPSQPRSEVCS